MDMTIPHHQLALRVVPDATGHGISAPAWGAAVATVGAWPSLEPVVPVLERRFWRIGDRGQLRESVVGGLRDPLGVCTAAEAQRELRELLRPLWVGRPLPP